VQGLKTLMAIGPDMRRLMDGAAKLHGQLAGAATAVKGVDLAGLFQVRMMRAARKVEEE
jgi:hypothetical protein